jgi:hypothetical protein
MRLMAPYLLLLAVGIVVVVLAYRLSVRARGVSARQGVDIEEALAVTLERLGPLLAVIAAEHPEAAGMGERALHAFCQHTIVPDRRFSMLFLSMPPAVVAAVRSELVRSGALPHGLKAAIAKRAV